MMTKRFILIGSSGSSPKNYETEFGHCGRTRKAPPSVA